MLLGLDNEHNSTACTSFIVTDNFLINFLLQKPSLILCFNLASQLQQSDQSHFKRWLPFIAWWECLQETTSSCMLHLCLFWSCLHYFWYLQDLMQHNMGVMIPQDNFSSWQVYFINLQYINEAKANVQWDAVTCWRVYISYADQQEIIHNWTKQRCRLVLKFSLG